MKTFNVLPFIELLTKFDISDYALTIKSTPYNVQIWISYTCPEGINHGWTNPIELGQEIVFHNFKRHIHNFKRHIDSLLCAEREVFGQVRGADQSEILLV
jgi:hypothetical protein